MSRKTDIGSSSRAQYTRSYDSIRGVDFSSDPSEVSANRAADLLNMYRDYDSEHGAAIETIPGYRCLFDLEGEIHGIWGYSSSQDESMRKYAVVHAGTRLYTFDIDKRDEGTCELRYEGLADLKSSAFVQNNKFFISDGNNIFVMKSDLTVCTLEEEAYLPITYLAGAAYEQRNMLCDKFINRDTAVAPEQFKEPKGTTLYGSTGGLAVWEQFKEGLVLDSDGKSVIDITNRTRDFDELDVRALLNTSYVKGEGSSPEYLKLTIELVQKFNIKRIIGDASTGDNNLSDEIKNSVEEYYSGFEEDTPMAGKYEADITIYEPCLELTKVTVGGKEIERYNYVRGGYDKDSVPDIFYLPVNERLEVDGVKKEYVSYIHIYSTQKMDLDTVEVDIYGIAEPINMQKSNEAAKHIDYISANKEYKGSAKDAILNCKIATTFDGRVFLTGNPKLPNTVFYSQRDLTGYNNPAYFGAYNYFNDGIDNAPNVAMLSTSSVLMVLKQNTLHGSSIYYHTAQDGLDDVLPRIYPSVPGVAGLGCEGEALNFLDDAIFVSDRGIEGVSKETLNLERTIGHRSSNIDRVLRERSLADVRMCRFGGYLCVFDGHGRVYLGDSRQLFQGVDGAVEYEWFVLDGIGGYRGYNERFKTLTVFPELGGGYTMADASYEGGKVSVSEVSEYVDHAELKSVELKYPEGKVTAHIVERDGIDVLCDSDGELEGGEFSPACVGTTIDGVLYFGTKAGQICCFNTDKRGKPFEGEQVGSDTIHREYYSFCGRRYTSYVALKSDNCGVPHLTKRTARKTCVMKLKAMIGSSVRVMARTDREGWDDIVSAQTNTKFSFDDMNFENFTFASTPETIVALKDKKKKWVEKQLLFISDDFKSPFGLYNVTYNYEIQGRVKK